MKDLSSAIAVLISNEGSADTEVLDRLSSRSTRFSMLGAIASIALQNSIDVSIRTGVIGLLHDISLCRHTDWFLDARGIPEDDHQEYQRHPIESAELLNGIDGLDMEFIRSVSQVHEQLDGSGFPRGLSGSQISEDAKILNFVDAFLTLVDPLIGTAKYFDADALAYLCHHACQGKFDRNVAMGVIEAVSLYPIGTVVELDDGSRVAVVESVPGCPTYPMVREFHSGSSPIDLRKSKRAIVGPVGASDRTDFVRIRKHQIPEILWQ